MDSTRAGRRMLSHFALWARGDFAQFLANDSCHSETNDMQGVDELLREKELALPRLRQEVQALRVVARRTWEFLRLPVETFGDTPF